MPPGPLERKIARHFEGMFSYVHQNNGQASPRERLAFAKEAVCLGRGHPHGLPSEEFVIGPFCGVSFGHRAFQGCHVAPLSLLGVLHSPFLIHTAVIEGQGVFLELRSTWGTSHTASQEVCLDGVHRGSHPLGPRAAPLSLAQPPSSLFHVLCCARQKR